MTAFSASVRPPFWRRVVLVLIGISLAVAVLYGVGLAAFAQRVSLRATPVDPPAADAIVALTGGGGARLKAAIGLLERQIAPHVLISGVHPDTSATAVAQLAGGDQALHDCCVTLGRAAATTRGNAHEAAAWAQAEGHQTLIIVTSDYHMPRALMELRRQMAGDAPGVRLIAYPVPRADAATPWWRDAKARQRLTVEYAKYLSVTAREEMARLGLWAPR